MILVLFLWRYCYDPISHPTVCLVGDVTTMSSGLWLLGNNLGLDQTGVFLSNFATNTVACCKNREYKPLVMSLHKNFIRVPKENILTASSNSTSRSFCLICLGSDGVSATSFNMAST